MPGIPGVYPVKRIEIAPLPRGAAASVLGEFKGRSEAKGAKMQPATVSEKTTRTLDAHLVTGVQNRDKEKIVRVWFKKSCVTLVACLVLSAAIGWTVWNATSDPYSPLSKDGLKQYHLRLDTSPDRLKIDLLPCERAGEVISGYTTTADDWLTAELEHSGNMVEDGYEDILWYLGRADDADDESMEWYREQYSNADKDALYAEAASEERRADLSGPAYHIRFEWERIDFALNAALTVIRGTRSDCGAGQGSEIRKAEAVLVEQISANSAFLTKLLGREDAARLLPVTLGGHNGWCVFEPSAGICKSGST